MNEQCIDVFGHAAIFARLQEQANEAASQSDPCKVMLSSAEIKGGVSGRELLRNWIKTIDDGWQAELADIKDQHHLACRYNRKAVQQLREFDKSRIDDLRKQIEEKAKLGPSPVVKEQADDFNTRLQASRMPRR